MAYIKNNWVDREGITRYFETVDDDGTLIFTPDYEKVTEIGTPVNADNMNHIEDGIEDHENRITVLEEAGDASNFLNKSQITNCLLEVPQRIKLELADGVLTLKAGSEVIIPNGFEADGVTPKFDYVNIESDSIVKNGANQQEIILSKNGNITSGVPSAWTYSGATQPTVSTTFAIWYDTANNKIKQTNNSGSTWLDGYSLPIALSTSNTAQYVSIDQVFNGMGYIGSTVWVDKGVKGLIPNGRNEDGSLRNIEFTTDRLLSFSEFNNDTSNYAVIDYNNGNLRLMRSSVIMTDYDFSNNFIKREDGLFRNSVIVAVANCSTNGITNFQPKQPFRAVDYNDAVVKSDKKEITGWSMPSNKIVQLTSGASGTVYTAPANGYIQCGAKNNNSNVAYLQIFIKEPETSKTLLEQQSWISYNATAGNTTKIFSPCQKGQLIYINYYNATINFLQFVYAEGDK